MTRPKPGPFNATRRPPMVLANLAECAHLSPWDDLSIERGELTPSLEVERAAVAEQNQQVLDALSG
ncbi:hypothetical protein [Mycobacterium antarcticum]|uniref:hypothetical protein n=1 Tax=Mycolicibacterium sp. TUM20985 TaxID=3023370 RepID=UPI0025723403|nr:hypothetical protein [Mycolicibacterium sp. TUM20985]